MNSKLLVFSAAVLWSLCVCGARAGADSSTCPLTGIKYAGIAPVVAASVPNRDAIENLLLPEMRVKVLAMGITPVSLDDPKCDNLMLVTFRTLPSPGSTEYECFIAELTVPDIKLTSTRLNKTVTATIWEEDKLDVCKISSAGPAMEADMNKLLADFAADYAKDNPAGHPSASAARTLTGLAAIYYATRHAAPISDLPHVYRSANGGFYYRKPDTHEAVWLTAPPNGIVVTDTDLSLYASDWAQYQGQAAAKLPAGALTQSITAFDPTLKEAS